MHLKSLTMQGFKSFANKTKIEFDKDITGVVGPNGSGKSNISDAITWVLGETSVKSLRGKKMEDVIFSGTNKRKPLGFAEVMITFDNRDRTLSYDFDEVSVTRKMYRSLESEYLINGQKVRLKDIKELFMDTGIGKDGYSLIGQGKIDEVLSNSPEKRRAIFEEASGISKYKQRKTEAENKLRRTDENITRLSDIISEIARNVDHLENESKRAKEYILFYEELKNLDLGISKRDYLNILSYLETRNISLKEKKENFEKMSSELLDIKEKEQKFKADISLLEEEIELRIDENFKNSTILNEIKSEIELTNQNIKNIEEKNIDLKSEEEALLLKSLENKNNLEALYKDQNLLLSEKEKISTLVEEKREDLEFFIKENKDFISKKDEYEERYLKSLENRSVMVSRIDTISRLIEERASRSDEITKLLKKIESDFLCLNSSKEDLVQKIKHVDKNIQEFENIKNELVNEIEEKKNKKKELEELIGEKNKIAIGFQTKIKSLKSVIDNFEGYSKSTKSFMHLSTNKNLFTESLLGPVGDNLRVKKEFETAINVALGASVQNIIVKDQSSVYKMIDILKKNNLGRLTFMPIDKLQPSISNFDLKPFLNTGILGYADSLIDFDDNLKKVFSYLLGRVVIAEDYDSAINFSNKTGSKFRVVTLDGESLNIGGTISGGSQKNNYSVLSRNTELEEFEEEYKKVSRFLVEKENELLKLNEILSTLISKLNENEDFLKDFREKITSYDEQNMKLSLSFENLNVAKNRYLLEKENMSKTFESDLNEKNSLSDNLFKIETEIENLKDLKEKNDRISLQNSEILETKKEELQNLNLKFEVNKEKLSSSKISIDRIAAENLESEKSLLNIKNTLEINFKKIIDAEEREVKLSENFEQHTRKKKELETNLEFLKTELKSKKESFEKYSLYIDEKKENIFKLEKEIIGLENNIVSRSKEKDDILERVFTQYEVKSFDEVIDEDFSVSESRNRIKVLKNEIKELGPVNLSSIEEYNLNKERLDFNIAQRDDLLKSKIELKEVIFKLEDSMKKKFKESMEKIGIYFNEIFITLFNGGQASIEIEEREDFLNAGIEIKAQPPGKRFQSLSLLSGGEKALTAVALLFALLKVRPAPFCILDEIDAALDDANVKRYCKYLKTLTSIQFILITHRKISMQIADVLYGVTMEELGISKIISTSLKE